MADKFPIVVQEWIESERGWGQRPDGCSIHLTLEDCEAYKKRFLEEERKRNPSGVVPEVYVRADGSPFVKDVNKKVFNDLKKLKQKDILGRRLNNLRDVETYLEKDKEIERKRKLKERALSKLTQAEKEALGL